MSRKALVTNINDYPTTPLWCCVNDAGSHVGLLSTDSDGSLNFDVLAC